ncbi:flavodoxin domain-containing protein [Actinoplanes sp. NPDC023714]|uniref:flavodoxin family protein n=1 Tax=Actinoplanes sp. NPDC023714 TaxID=3154322 RepID=UPI0033E53697
MRALVVYESMFGNTEAVARAVAEGLGTGLEVTVADVRTGPNITATEILVVGAPTHAFSLSRPGTRADAATKGTVRPGATATGVRELLDDAPRLDGIAAATFGTKVDMTGLPGSAARKAHRMLRGHGARMIAAAENFHVAGMTGPLTDGELDHARRWGAELAASARRTRVTG